MSNDTWVNIIYYVDTDEARANLNAVAREEEATRQRIRLFASQSMQLFNQTISLYRTVMRISGQAIDEVFNSVLSLLQGMISVAITTKLLADAQTLIGNVLAIASAFMAGIAIGNSLKALQEALEAKAEARRTSQRTESALNNTQWIFGGF